MHLEIGNCHGFCFKCRKATYDNCSKILPGIFSFCNSDKEPELLANTPWIIKTSCTDFESLSPSAYFKNFNSFKSNITVANYEVLEGMYFGFARGKRPCFICAGVNESIYKRCYNSERIHKNIPCSKILAHIFKEYNTTSGMIKFI